MLTCLEQPRLWAKGGASSPKGVAPGNQALAGRSTLDNLMQALRNLPGEDTAFDKKARPAPGGLLQASCEHWVPTMSQAVGRPSLSLASPPAPFRSQLALPGGLARSQASESPDCSPLCHGRAWPPLSPQVGARGGSSGSPPPLRQGKGGRSRLGEHPSLCTLPVIGP